MRIYLFLALGTALLLHAGCGGNSDAGRPADLPRLFPVNITVTQEGTPLEGASVTLTVTSSTYTPSGTTNASGVAAMQTYGFPGAPAGEHVVLISKIGIENLREEQTPEGEIVMVGGQRFRYIDPQFSNAASTPHRITVTERGGANATFEVGAPVRIFLGNNE
jgi:hypothetical protein